MKLLIIPFLLVYSGIYAQPLKPLSFYARNPKVSKEAKLFFKKIPGYQKKPGSYYSDPRIEELTSSVLDSVFTENAETRPFYIYLMNKNSQLTDGALMMSSIIAQYKLLQTNPAVFFQYMLDNPAEKKKYFADWASDMSGFSDQYCANFLHVEFDTCLSSWSRNIMGLLSAEKSSVLSLAKEFFGLMNIPDNTAPGFTLGAADNNKTYRLVMGTQFEVRLRECRGCASNWQNIKIDSSKIELTAEVFDNPSCTNCTGGNHDHIFQFKVKGQGMSVLTFTYFSDKINFFIDGH